MDMVAYSFESKYSWPLDIASPSVDHAEIRIVEENIVLMLQSVHNFDVSYRW